MGRGLFYYVILASVLAVLTLSANTSFAGFPRLCRLIADDNYLPQFTARGRRLVHAVGIAVLALLFISRGEGDDAALRGDWAAYVDAPLRRAGHPGPRLEIIASPYRRLIRPVVDYVDRLKGDYPTRLIAVLIRSRWRRDGTSMFSTTTGLRPASCWRRISASS
jgi:hypothetical protein